MISPRMQQTIAARAVANGMRPLRQGALTQMARGVTSLDEVVRNT